jgi:hypothetical protein
VERPTHVGGQQAIDVLEIAAAKRGIEILHDGQARVRPAGEGL